MKFGRRREREIFRQIQARNHRHTGVFRGFRNAELAEKIRSQRGLSFTPGSWNVPDFREPEKRPCLSDSAKNARRVAKRQVLWPISAQTVGRIPHSVRSFSMGPRLFKSDSLEVEADKR